MTPHAVSTAASPAAVLTRGLPPDESIQQIRGLLLGGYGPGAGEGVVMASTRDRQMIGGESTWVRRARTAERARGARNAVPPRIGGRIPQALITIAAAVLMLGLARMLPTRAGTALKLGRRRL